MIVEPTTMQLHEGPQILSPTELKARLEVWSSKTTRFPWFKGSSKELPEWFPIIEEACEANFIHPSQRSDAAIEFLSGELQPVMEERKAKYIHESGEKVWEWQDFKEDLARVMVEAERIVAEEKARKASALGVAKDTVSQFREDHPYIAASASAGLVVGGSVVLFPALGLMALNAIGFTAGSIAGASVLRSIIYGGAAGGLFSFIKSTAGTVTASASAAGSGVASYVTGSKGKAEEDVPPPYSREETPPAPAPAPAPIEVKYPVFVSKRRATTNPNQQPTDAQEARRP